MDYDQFLDDIPRGYTVAQVAARYRVSGDKVRTWIRNGELKAINTANRLKAKPRFLILPDSLADFEKGRRVIPILKRTRARRITDGEIDYFPD